MRHIVKGAITAAVIAVVTGAIWTADSRWGAHVAAIRLLDVKPFVFIETKLSGEQIRHEAYHAHIAADPATSIADMDAYAERLFTDQLRDKAERDGKTEVWITFNLGHVVANGQDLVKTFRTIFRRTAAGWQRVAPSSSRPASLPTNSSASLIMFDRHATTTKMAKPANSDIIAE